MDDDPRQRGAPQEGLHARPRRRGRSRRQGQRDDLGRQHRRHDGVGAAADGPHQGRQPPGDRDRDPRARARRPPCCSTPAPTPRCSPTGWCSSRRWVRCTPRTASASQNPKVGLLSIGEEPGKGDTLRKEAFPLLEAAPGINFIGNVEGRDVMTDDRRRRRHRRVHRQRRAEDARGRPAHRRQGAVRGVRAATRRTSRTPTR